MSERSEDGDSDRSPSLLGSSSSAASSTDTEIPFNETRLGQSDESTDTEDSAVARAPQHAFKKRQTYTKSRGFHRARVSTHTPASEGRARQDRTWSDSDNSYEFDRERKIVSKKRLLNFEGNSDCVWGQRSLQRRLDLDQLDRLIGLAHGTEHGFPLHGEGDDIQRRPMANSHAPQDAFWSGLLQNPNTPLPPSMLNFFSQRAIQNPEFDDQLSEQFGDSALVAVGMFIEEIITASLLPHAGFHVLRCRALEMIGDLDDTDSSLSPPSHNSAAHPLTGERISYDVRNMGQNESAFQAWTLPPEEAAMKLAEQGFLPKTGIDFWKVPTRTPAALQGGGDEFLQHLCDQTFRNQDIVSKNKDLVPLFQESSGETGNSQTTINPEKKRKHQTLGETTVPDDRDVPNFTNNDPTGEPLQQDMRGPNTLGQSDSSSTSSDGVILDDLKSR
eukprot:Nitzschia sp. Nitz4//scaffold112_size70979//22144//23478//NITZ4_005898-RA/size70979-processed-gene-0.35-mRNA-1//1//CDS//3329533253//7328//frame0